MSMVTTNVAQVLTQEQVRKAPARPYKARVATKVKWALGDAMESSRQAQRRMKTILDRMEEARTIAEATADARMLAVLGKLDHEIAILALGVAEMERGLALAIAECKPEVKAKKKYSEL